MNVLFMLLVDLMLFISYWLCYVLLKIISSYHLQLNLSHDI